MAKEKETTNTLTVILNPEKVTKNTIRFTEVLESDLDVPSIGTIYVPKATLKAIGYAEGKTLKVTLSI